MARNNYSVVKQQFENKRNEAQQKAEMRKARLRAQSPEYAEVEEAIVQTGVELMRIMQDISHDRSADILKNKEKMKSLRALRSEILSSLGYNDSYIQPQYECNVCQDTGLVGIDVCDCFVKALRVESYLSSGLGKALVRQRFEILIYRCIRLKTERI